MSEIIFIPRSDDSIEVTYVESENNQIEIIYTEQGHGEVVFENFEPIEIEYLPRNDDLLVIEYVPSIDSRVAVSIELNVIEYTFSEIAIYKILESTFRRSFNATTDWTQSAGGYYINFNHGMNSEYTIEEVKDFNGNKVLAEIKTISENISQLWVPHDFRFAGKILIKI